MGQLQRFHYNETINCKQATLISQFPNGSHIMMRPFYKLFFLVHLLPTAEAVVNVLLSVAT
jgi:hypothetical protein